MGIEELFQSSIEAIDPYIRPAVCSNIIVTGGSSRFEGFYERFKNGIMGILDEGFRSRIWHEPDDWFFVKKMTAFSQREDFVDGVITKKKFDEYGSLALIDMLRL